MSLLVTRSICSSDVLYMGFMDHLLLWSGCCGHDYKHNWPKSLWLTDPFVVAASCWWVRPGSGIADCLGKYSQFWSKSIGAWV